MISETDIAYIAGLFDGEGSIDFKKRKEKKRAGTYDCWRISMEISMTDESVLRWVHEVLGCGTVIKKPRKGLRKDGTKYLMQWKWRCTFRDAYYVCRYFGHIHIQNYQRYKKSLTTTVIVS